MPGRNDLDWDKLRVFHTVAQAGSFTHAGDELNLSQSAISRQISALEDDLSVPLFHRHARGLKLTEQGEVLFRTAHDVFDRLAATRMILADTRNKPTGELRVTTTVGFGSTWLTPRIKQFMELYPDIRPSIICEDRELDLAMREADVAIRLYEPTQPDLIKRRLVTVHYHIYASRDYLKTHGTPRTVEELARHPIVTYGSSAPQTLRHVNWLLVLAGKASGRRPEPILQVNNIYGLMLAVEAGVGIAGIPDYMAMEHPELVRILPEIEGPTVELFFVYAEEMRNTKRVQVFRDFLLGSLKDSAF